MDIRMKKIIKLISKEYYVTAKEMSNALGISTKTVRSLIKNLNDLLLDNGAVIESKSGFGYILKIKNHSKFEKFNILDAKNIIPNSSEERIQYLIEYLLNIKSYIKVEDICKMLFISSKTLSKDLKKMETILDEYNIKLERKPYYGIKLKGEEFNIRLCIANYIEKKDFNLIDKKEITKISEIVLKTLNKENYKISDTAFQNLIIHIQVAVKRIKSNLSIDKMQNNLMEYIDEKSFDIAKKCSVNLEKEFNIQISKTEVMYIAIHLAGKKIFNKDKIDFQNFVIDKEIGDIINEMLNKINELFKFDFSRDLELRISLAQHLMPLRIRVKFDMKLKNPILDKIKERFSLPYTMAKYASTVFYDYYKKILSEDEIGYIALNFALALERQRKDINKKNILLVCSSGAGSAQLLAYTYENTFKDYINEVKVCGVYELENIDFKNIDYIFTTVPIKVKVPVPIQEVSYFLENKNIRDIKRILYFDKNNSVINYYDKNLFITDIKLKNKNDILKYMVNHLKKYKNIPKNFLESVEKREKLGITEFGNKIAIPHPHEMITSETFVCIGILDKPIIWDFKEVQLVFLVSISEKDKKKLKYFYKVAAKILIDKEKVNKIIETRSYDDLMFMIENIEKSLESDRNE